MTHLRMPGRLAVGAALCGSLSMSCDPGTGGAIVDVVIEVRGRSDARTFTTATGWTVTLSSAHAAVGPIYLFEKGSVLAWGPPADDRSWLLRFVVPAAHAHPGHNHYDGGLAKGEWLGQVVVDGLSDTPATRAGGPGTGGQALSASVHLEPPRTDLAGRERLQEQHLFAEGIARKDGWEIPFRGGLAIPAEGEQRVVQGLPLTANLDEGTVVTFVLNPDAWFQEANFETLLDQLPDEQGRYPITPGSQVERAWFIGARSVAAAGGLSSFTVTSNQAGEE